MKENKNRRTFLQNMGLVTLGLSSSVVLPANQVLGNAFKWSSVQDSHDLKSLSPSSLFSVLDLNLSELKVVRQTLDNKGYDEALQTLLDYYRKKYPKYTPKQIDESAEHKIDVISRARDIKNHIFQWGPYEAADYGPDIDWAADPAGDIEWVAGMYRFYWAEDLANAYQLTHDEVYAQAFVDLTKDWIQKHPLEDTIDEVHPVYGPGKYGSSGWKGYAWLDLQTGIRATNICQKLRIFLHADSFTPQFLGTLLASLYDHQVKTEKMPMNMVHNKAIFEQRGFFNVLHTFPEYKDKERWLDLAIGITAENLLAQTTTDGVQREWCGGYHAGVYRDVLEINGRVNDLGRQMPVFYSERVKAMADHIFGVSTPDLGFPMFGDTARKKLESKDRKTWALYPTLIEASKKFKDPKFQALADLKIEQLPSIGSKAFSDAGLYVMRNAWTPDQVYMAIHCSPPAISSHDTPDNGTFELYAYGRWLMPDTGFYTYGHDKEARAWHRQTRVHPTLTVDGKDTSIIGREMCWESTTDLDVLCVENQSYSRLLHRRTIWFVGKKSDTPFYVILDEAIGDAEGDIAIHFPMAPGTVKTNEQVGRIWTEFDDVNLLVQVVGKKPISLVEEEGWHAWSYGERERRTSVSAVYKGRGPFVFVSVLVPFKGLKSPEVELLTAPEQLIAGMNPVELVVEVAKQQWILKRTV